MATTRLMPLHTGKGRTVGQAISDIIDYTENPQKTDGGRLITSWQCDSRIADAEFLFNKNQYIQKTSRVRGEDDVIAYHLRQSFVPGEITPEDANRLGCELAKLKLSVSVLRNINGFPMCGCCSFGFKTRRFICRMSIFATGYTANRRR